MGSARGGSNPPGVDYYGVLAQSEACVLSKHEVLGSKPGFAIFGSGTAGTLFPIPSRCTGKVVTGGTGPPSYGHTTVNLPHPIRTAKSSTVGPDQYFGRGLQGNLGCCMAFYFLNFVNYFFQKKIKNPEREI